MDQRIGELLSRIIPLTDHDVEEILHEQQATNQKFGDIALSLGLCKPEDLLRAWLRQLEHPHRSREHRTPGRRLCKRLLHLTRELSALRHQALPVARDRR